MFGKKKSKKLHPEVLKDLLENTDFTAKEIMIFYKSCIQLFPKGRLTKWQFTTLFEEFFPFGNSDELAEYVYLTYDINNDEYIDFQEYMYAVSFIMHGNYRKKLRWVFQLFDHNKDGFISLMEMWLTVKAIFKAMRGFVEHECTRSLCRLVKEIFTKMDLNRDWRISKYEFLRGVEAEPLFLEILDCLTLYSKKNDIVYTPEIEPERPVRLVKIEHSGFSEAKKRKATKKYTLQQKQLSIVSEQSEGDLVQK
ncbi:hypothetical protein TKK_0001462 [Trichogramma kaykai]